MNPSLEDPSKQKTRRDEIAREIHAGQDEDDFLFWADVNDRGVLTVGSYMAGFFLDESTNDSA